MVEWVDLQPIFDVCARETVYEGGKNIRVTWWRQVEEEKYMKVTVEDILAVARVLRRREYVSRGESEGESEVGITDREW